MEDILDIFNEAKAQVETEAKQADPVYQQKQQESNASREQAIRDRRKEQSYGSSILEVYNEALADVEIENRRRQRDNVELYRQSNPELVRKTNDLLLASNERWKQIEIYRSMTPEERNEVLRIAPGVAQELGDKRDIELGPVGRTMDALKSGLANVSQPVMEMSRLGGTTEEMDYFDQLKGLQAQEFHPYRADDPWYIRGPLQAVEMAPWMATVAGSGGVGGGIGAASTSLGTRLLASTPKGLKVLRAANKMSSLASKMRLPAITGKKLGELSGVTAAATPGMYVQEYDQLRELGMEDGAKLRLLALGTAAVGGLVEGIVPNPFQGKLSLSGGPMRAAREYLWEAAKKAPGELSEEYLQGVTSGLGEHVAQYLDENAEDKTVGEAFRKGWDQTKEAALPMAFLLGVPAVGGAGFSAVEARRRKLANLQDALANGPVSRKVAKENGIEGANQAERTKNAEQVVADLEQEIAEVEASQAEAPEEQLPAETGVTPEATQPAEEIPLPEDEGALSRIAEMAAQREGAPIADAMGDAGSGIVDNMYRGILDSIKETGEVPPAEQGSNVGVAWERLKGSVAPEAFVADLQAKAPSTPEQWEELVSGLQNPVVGTEVTTEQTSEQPLETTSERPGSDRWLVMSNKDGKPIFHSYDANEKENYKRLQTREEIDSSKEIVIATHDGHGKPFDPETLKARKSFAEKATPGAEFVSTKYPGSRFRINEDGPLGSLTDMVSGRTMSSPSEFANYIDPEEITWVKEGEPAKVKSAPTPEVTPETIAPVQTPVPEVTKPPKTAQPAPAQPPSLPKAEQVPAVPVVPKEKQPPRQVSESLSSLPPFKGASFELNEADQSVKVARPDGLTTTIYFRADDRLKDLTQDNLDGAYIYRGSGDGKYNEGDILLGSNATRETLAHEVSHWLERNGVITPEEVEKYGGREALAEKYAKWATKKQRAKDTVFQKIYDAIESLISAQSRFFKDVSQRQKPADQMTDEQLGAELLDRAGMSISETVSRGGKYKGQPGWTVSGLSKEAARELAEAGYSNKRIPSRKGGDEKYRFRKDPTDRLLEIAEEVEAEARQAAEAEARGNAISAIGEVTPEVASEYEKLRSEWKERYEVINEPVRQLAAARNRAKEATGLSESDIRRISNGGFDYSSDTSKYKDKWPQLAKKMRFFDEFASEVQGEYPDLIDAENASQDVWDLLVGAEQGIPSFEEYFEANAGEIVDEMLASMEEEVQTVIPGTEEAVEASDRARRIKDASGKFDQVKSVITSEETTDPNAEIDALIEAEFEKQIQGEAKAKRSGKKKATKKKKAIKKKAPKKSKGKKPTKIQEKRDAAREEADDLWAEFNKKAKDKLMSGLDPELATLAVRIARAEIKVGTLTFAAFVESVVKKVPVELLDRVKPYMESAWRVAHKLKMTDDPGGRFDDFLPQLEYGTVEKPNRVAIGRYFQEQLESGKEYARITQARKEVGELVGGTIEAGTLAAKAVDEAVEQGVVRAARNIVSSEGTKEQKFDRLLDLYQRQPRLGVRTGTSQREQAFSTPAPLAYLASILTDTEPGMVVYDSSAGNGMLLIGTNEQNAIANELNEDRAEALRELGYDVNEGDGTKYVPERKPDRIIINPPFSKIDGKTWSVGGVKTEQIDHAIVMHTLKSLPKDGKAVLIIGAKGFEKGKPKDEIRRAEAYKNQKSFYNHVYNNYNVTDHFTVDGGLYAKQGASFPVDVIVIDGRGKSELPLPYQIDRQNVLPRVIETWEGLKDVAKRHMDTGNSRPGSLSTEEKTDLGGLPELLEGELAKAGKDRKGGSGRRDQSGGGVLPGGRSSDIATGKPDRQPDVPESASGKARGESRPVPTDAKADGTRGTRDTEAVGGRDSELGVDAETQFQVPYKKKSGQTGVDTLVPRTQVAAVQRALDTAEERYGNLDEFVASELGYEVNELGDYFSAEQVDALALNIARHKEGKAFVLGDQTGVGKGRVAAGMMVYAKQQGLVPVFITQSPNLFADMYRDLSDIGQHSLEKPFFAVSTNDLSGDSTLSIAGGMQIYQKRKVADEVMKSVAESVVSGGPKAKAIIRVPVDKKGKPLGKTKSGKQRWRQVKGDFDAVFTTYSQLQTKKGELKTRHLALQGIAPKAFFILDESHSAGGTAGTSSDARAGSIRRMLDVAQGASFLSATYAKRPQVMDLYAKTGMSSSIEGGPDEMIRTLLKGGVPLQQVLSEMLVESGAYMRRERSYDGVEFGAKVKDVGLQESDEVAGVFSAINRLDMIKNQIVKSKPFKKWLVSQGLGLGKDSATGNRGMESTEFSSIMHNLVDQMLLAIKADIAADEAIDSIKRGESPVIALSNTMGSALGHYLEANPDKQVGDEIDFRFNTMADRYLERSREIMLVDKMPDGSKKSTRLRLPDGVLGEDGVAAYNHAKDLVDQFASDLPASPIDHIRNRIEQAGYTVAEITGRDNAIDYSGETMVLSKRPSSEKGAAGKNNSIKKFNAGELDVLILNVSGATGLSIHASRDFKNQKRRHMIISQPDKNIDTFMQMLGRIHRTGQVTEHEGMPKGSNLPRYTLLMSEAPAEIRPAAVLMKKLSSLNANVTADSKGAVSFDVPDILNKVGDRIVAEYLAENPTLNAELDTKKGTGLVEVSRDGVPKVVDELARKASGRLAMRPIAEQQAFWDTVGPAFENEIKQLEALGKNPLTASKVDLQAEVLEQIDIFKGDRNEDSPFLQPAFANRVRVKKQGEPFTPEEIKEQLGETFEGGGLPSNRDVAAWINKNNEAVESRMAKALESRLGQLVDPVAMASARDSADQTKRNIRTKLNAFAPGKMVTVVEEGVDGGQVTGVVLSLKPKEGKEHTMSGWTAKIALASPDRVLSMPLTRLGVVAGEPLPGEVSVHPQHTVIVEEHFREFEDGGDAFEERVVGTGNVLAAFDQLVGSDTSASGNIVFFTDSDGNTNRGVLMPRSFSMEKWQEQRPVTFQTPDQVIQFLNVSSEFQVNSPDYSVQIMAEDGNLVIRSPKSRHRSGKYTANKQIIDASGTDFVSVGQIMQMVVPKRNQKAVIEAILDVGPLVTAVSQGKNTARAIVDGDKGADTLYQKEQELSEGLQEKAEAVLNEEVVEQSLDIAFAARDAGIKTFDELVAFSVKTVGERRTRMIGAYLQEVGKAVKMKGVRPTRDVLGVPGVTRGQAVAMARAAFPAAMESQIDDLMQLEDITGFGRDEIGFAPAGSPVPGASLKQDGENDKTQKTDQAETAQEGDSGGNETKQDRGRGESGSASTGDTGANQRGKERGIKGWTQFISATRAIIGATDKADVSTFIHEFFHPMRRFLLDKSVPQEQRAGITNEDIQALEDYVGVKNGNWTVAAEEKAAKAWERYWFEGIAPIEALRSLFEKLARWMREVYTGVQEITNNELTPEVRALFDKIVQRGFPEGIKTPELPDRAVPPNSPSHPEKLERLNPNGHDLTALGKGVMNYLRDLADIPGLESTTKETVRGWVEEAQMTVAADPDAPLRMFNEIVSQPGRSIDQHEAMLLAFHYRKLANIASTAMEESKAAAESGDPVRIANARTAFIRARQPMTEFEEITYSSKSTWGRTGIALQVMLRNDFTEAGLMRRARDSNHGKPLTPAQEKEMAALAKKVAEMQAEVDSARERAERAEAELESIRQHKDVVGKTKRKSRQATKKQKSVLDSAWEKVSKSLGIDTLYQDGPLDELVNAYRAIGVNTFAELMRHVEQRAGKKQAKTMRDDLQVAWVNTRPDIPIADSFDSSDARAMTKLARRIQRYVVEGGIEDREEVLEAVQEELTNLLERKITRRQTMDALSAYGQYSMPSQEGVDPILRKINAELLKQRQIDQLGEALVRAEELRKQGMSEADIGDQLVKENMLVQPTGNQRDKPWFEIRKLQRDYAEMKSQVPVSTEGRAGMLQTTLGAIERGLVNRISDLKDAIESNERINNEREELTKVYREMFPPIKRQLTEEQRIRNAVKAAERSIATMQKQIDNRNFDKAKSVKVTSPELEALRAQQESMRARIKALKSLELEQWESEGGAIGPDPKEAAIRKAYIASLNARAEKYRKMIAEKDFEPKTKEPRKLTRAELDAQRRLADARQEALEAMAQYHLENLKGIRWAADKVMETAHLSRAVMTSMDASALLNQGAAVALGRPGIAKRTLQEVVTSMAYAFDKQQLFSGKFNWKEAEQFFTGIDSRQAEFDFIERLNSGTWGEFRLKAGLEITSSDQEATKQEEVFAGRWGRSVPGVAISGRIYTMMINKMRADLFDVMANNLARDGKPTLEEAKLIASFVNVATGRSDFKGIPVLEQFKNYSHALNTVFFAPRYVASRFQYLFMPFYLPFSGGVSKNWRAKKAIYKELARTFTGFATVLGAVAMSASMFWDDDDEDKPTVGIGDSTSSDFLKVKMGDTRIDFAGGIQQAFVLMSRIGQQRIGERKFGEGYKPATTGTTLSKFARSKLAPVPGFVVTGLNDWENVVGQKEDKLLGYNVHPSIGTASNLFLPLSMNEVGDTMREQGAAKGTVLTALSLLGVRISTYGDKTKYLKLDEPKRTEMFEKDLKQIEWDSPRLEYEEYLTAEQAEQVAQKREESRQDLVYKASAAPDRDNYDSDEAYEKAVQKRDEAARALVEANWGGERARQLLLDYWTRNSGTFRQRQGRRIVVKDAVRRRLRQIDQLLAIPE